MPFKGRMYPAQRHEAADYLTAEQKDILFSYGGGSRSDEGSESNQ